MLNPTMTIAQIVLEHSECAPVFQQHRIDFCCRGDLSLAAACASRSVDVDGLTADLEHAIAMRRGRIPTDPRSMTTGDLVDHIVSIHHTYVREAFAFVVPLAQKVARVHGNKHPALVELEQAIRAFRDLLEPHLDDEEQALFPVLTSDRADGDTKARLATALEEHSRVGGLLAHLRAVGDDYAPPDWACASHRTLLDELSALELDTLRHIHLENNVLIPRFAS
jgi:regulator of cell morphogenesis and NO signaling